MKKITALLLALLMVASIAGCSKKEEVKDPDFYTYYTYASSLATNWNPHTWENSGDSAVLAYITTPFVGMSIEDSTNGVYQWTYLAATAITDVTAEHQDDLDKYGSSLPAGKTSADITEGYVYEFKLNPELRWETGEGINADDYIESFKALLDPEMKNYRANLYIAGESAVAGGAGYYYSGSIEHVENLAGDELEVADLTVGEDGQYVTADGGKVWFSLTNALSVYLGGYALQDYYDAYGEQCFDPTEWDALVATENDEGLIALTDDSLAALISLISGGWGEDETYVPAYLFYDVQHDSSSFDAVGLYKVDDYTIRYVLQTAEDINYFLTSCTDNWLVYLDKYNANKDTTGKLVTTSYGTSLDTTVSYGPYKMTVLQADKQMIFEKNEQFYGFTEKDETTGRISGLTPWLVDGKNVEWYMTDKVQIDVMTEDAAKQAFLKGQIADWTPTAADLKTYRLSERLVKVDETYTMVLFFDCDLADLQEMDASKGNKNSVVLSNKNFRNGMSLAIDREEWAKTTSGYKPTYGMLNGLYYYDIYNDPESTYRGSQQAMGAIVDFYGIEYGEGKTYATLKEAYDSVNGYNLTEAKALFTKACEELVADGLYTAGDEILIRVAWAYGPIESAEQQQVAKLQEFLNAAVEGTGFGTITLEPIGNLQDPSKYDAVPAGEYAIGYGGWGGAAFYPFRTFQVYCDPDQYSLFEAACWHPETELLTLTVNGKDVTMTYQEWSNSMIGTAPYANADFDTKLQITANLETAILNNYYDIPLVFTTSCSLLSYQVDYYTMNYQIMYGFGGLELMTYNYTNGQWAEFVKSQGGTLSYE